MDDLVAAFFAGLFLMQAILRYSDGNSTAAILAAVACIGFLLVRFL